MSQSNKYRLNFIPTEDVPKGGPIVIKIQGVNYRVKVPQGCSRGETQPIELQLEYHKTGDRIAYYSASKKKRIPGKIQAIKGLVVIVSLNFESTVIRWKDVELDKKQHLFTKITEEEYQELKIEYATWYEKNYPIKYAIKISEQKKKLSNSLMKAMISVYQKEMDSNNHTKEVTRR